MYHMYYDNGILGWLMSIMHFALPILFIFILFNLFRNKNDSTNNFPKHRSEKRPLSILKERYAKGEISREEFQKMKDEIKS